MVQFIEKEVTNKNEMEALYSKSALTFEGIGRKPVNVNFILRWLEEHKATIQDKEVLIWWCSGQLMNSIYGFTGHNAYPNDINIMIIDSDTISMEKIILARFDLNGRWLDDIIDNNLRRESE